MTHLKKEKTQLSILLTEGVNALYIMTHNINGDNKDVWPWLGGTSTEAKTNAGASARFDVAKLEEWRLLFEFMQEKGVVPYLVLEDDSAWTGFNRVRYYREIVARFGYLPALIFNIAEEFNENYYLSTSLSFAQTLKNIDPFKHPVGIHNVNSPSSTYIDSSQVDFTAIQTKGTDPLIHNPTCYSMD